MNFFYTFLQIVCDLNEKSNKWNSKKKFKKNKNIREKTLKHLKGVVDILFEDSTFSPRNCSKFNFVH